MYEELIKALKSVDVSDMCPCNEFGMCLDKDCIVDQARDAIEELTRKVETLEKQIDDGVEAAKQAIAGIERYACQIQEKVNSLDDHQHYSGRYIKSIMEVEEWFTQLTF